MDKAAREATLNVDVQLSNVAPPGGWLMSGLGLGLGLGSGLGLGLGSGLGLGLGHSEVMWWLSRPERRLTLTRTLSLSLTLT